MKNNSYIIILLLFSKIIFSQNYIFDYNNNPVPHAHVYYTDVDGFVSNEDGLFNLSEDIRGDTLYISHVSYKLKKILVRDISKGDTIFMESAKISLEEVIVSSISAKTLVARAINKIKDNYIQSSYNLYGFFRQSLQEDSTGVEMTEVDFVSYVKNKTSTYNTKILKARRTKNFAKLNIETHSGVLDVIRKGDFVRRKSNFLNPNKLDEYKYTYAKKDEFMGLGIFKIIFEPKDEGNVSFLRKGVLYIDSTSLAFLEIKYSCDKKKLFDLKNDGYKKDYKKLYLNTVAIENVIKYRRIKGKWVLSYIEVKNKIKGSYRSEKYEYDLTAKLVVSNVNINEPMPVKTNYKLRKDFNAAVRKFDEIKNISDWDDNYKMSLSNNEKKILEDIGGQ